MGTLEGKLEKIMGVVLGTVPIIKIMQSLSYFFKGRVFFFFFLLPVLVCIPRLLSRRPLVGGKCVSYDHSKTEKDKTKGKKGHAEMDVLSSTPHRTTQLGFSSLELRGKRIYQDNNKKIRNSSYKKLVCVQIGRLDCHRYFAT